MAVLTREDVVAAYRAILGHDPNSEATIDEHLGHATVAELINALAASPDAQAWTAQRFQPLNSFVAVECARKGIPGPDIPVFLSEHYGQCAEDVIVAGLLQALSRNRGLDLSCATYLEVGGNHAVATSATFLLRKRFRMSGVIVEADPDLIPDLCKGRPHDTVLFGAVQPRDVQHLTLIVANRSELSSLDERFLTTWRGTEPVAERARLQVPALRINDIIAEHFPAGGPDFLSVDVEGVDLAILRDLDFQCFRPMVIQIEPSEHFAPGTATSMIEVLREARYSLVAETLVNLIFVAHEAFDPLQG